MLGLSQAALYSIPPCRLGFCGQKAGDAYQILDGFLRGKNSPLQAKKALKAFEAAYPYYCLIAKANSVFDPLDQRVVEAYWIGSSLLEKIKDLDIKEFILREFTKPGLLTPEEAKKRADLVPRGARAHHSLHVFILGSITGRVKLVGKLRDVCRIGWGEVIGLRPLAKDTSEVTRRDSSDGGGKQAAYMIVNYQPLIEKEGRLFLGSNRKKKIAWEPEFAPGVKIGDTVSFHWNRICQVLSNRQQKNLERYTRINIEAFNARKIRR